MGPFEICAGMVEADFTEPGIVEFARETESVIVELALNTEAVDEVEELDDGEAVPARADWWRAARWLVLSLCAGTRCRGGNKGGGAGSGAPSG